uniref:RAS p21 protein activator 2 n=1 Tax=Mus musculus TaxID=10090 RepID=D3YZE9_MOUSE
MAAAAPAAAASPEAPAVSGSADPETGDEDSREMKQKIYCHILDPTKCAIVSAL